MADTLRNKTALVTGSTSGIGLAIAQGLAAEGCNIALNGFGEPGEIEAIRSGLEREHGVRAIHSDADMSNGDAIGAFVAEVEEQLGAVDILVNNVGIQHVEKVEDFPPAKWEKIIAINLSSNFYAIRAALPGMKARKWGRIVNIASAHGLVASPFKTAYVAAKHGVVGLTKSVALEIAEEPNLTCNAICPGFVKTPLVDGQIADQARANDMSEDRVVKEIILASQPNKRFVQTHEIAAFVRLLCSEEGRSFNGAALSIDGGWTAR